MYRSQAFHLGFKLTDFPRPPQDGDELVIYQHAVAFIDRIIEEAALRDLPLRDRLDAQGILWCVTKWGGVKEEWSADEIRDFQRYLGKPSAK